MSGGQGTLSRAPRPSSLADVLDLILDKGLVIDAYVRISAVGIEILTIDARIVIASVDTYLHFAEAVNRLDLRQSETAGITGLFGDDHSGDSSSDDSSGDDSSGDDSSDGQQAPARRRSGGRPARRKGGSGDDDDPGSGRSEKSDDDERQGRQPANLVRRLADRGKWEDE
jgi:hypothetical protein